ncbi:hypothetical protein NEIMUCOT_04021 [Neisseria mucosa ATCC 25996]|uniref:Uncharacterized protein n=1 Tax=Neisseria mucosa (strain ATCC 25996 / DSM 4631 / NCTC 10774 / M26) TaxID=546266 RepID=D2ZTT4_NEIM2|nr:hypothetical protein NEIMUCOT_04021 [Neisseria mucosa ATCC 25996]
MRHCFDNISKVGTTEEYCRTRRLKTQNLFSDDLPLDKDRQIRSNVCFLSNPMN